MLKNFSATHNGFKDCLNSDKLYKRACISIPEGVSSPGRKFSEVESSPIFIERAEGAYVWDYDGNAYVDFMNGLGPIILGHANSEIVSAIESQAKKGTVYGLSNALEIDLAEEIIRCSRGVDQIRFVCSGSEATMSAIRLAKHHTSRKKILKFSGSYHGHTDSLLGHSIKTTSSKIGGVDNQIHENTIMCEYNNITELKEIFKSSGHEISAVIVEPYASNMGLVKPIDGFLKTIRDMCDSSGSILIFDEVVTAFRLAYGSVSEMVGVTPDLTIFGKIIGGGTPVGAYGGRVDIMQHLEEDELFQGGTFSSNPLTMAAGLKTLELLRENDVYTHINQLSVLLSNELNDLFQRKNLPLSVDRAGSLVSFVFCNGKSEMRNLRDNLSQDRELFSSMHTYLLKQGFMLAPTIDEPLFISYAHTQDHIMDFSSAVERYFDGFTS